MKSLGLSLVCLLLVGASLMVVLQGNAPITASPVTIAISTTPLSSPFILADKFGLFAKQGLTVQLRPMHGGHRCFEALMNDEVDLATTSESVVMYNAFKRNDFSIIATFVTSDNDVKLTAKRQRGIQALTDLKNLRVGMIKSTASEYFFQSALTINGLGNDGNTAVYLDPEALGQALIEDKVDVVSLWEPYANRLTETLKDQAVQLPTKGLYRLSFNLVTRRTEVRSDRTVHVALLRALNEAISLIHRDPKLAKSVVSDYLGLQAQELNVYWPDYLFRLGLDKPLQLELISQAYWAISAGYVEQKAIPDFRDFIDDSALKLLSADMNNGG